MHSRAILLLSAIVLFGATPALAAPAEAYQFAVVPGSATYGQVAFRTNTVSGQSTLCVGTGAPCVQIVDATPVPAGDYRLNNWMVGDASGAQRTWSVTRLDTKSGRMWLLNFDGKTTASWTEAK